ncbi:hypothetical protein LAG90_00140 [Marinilongibacter aquaticus]|uniref:hypothetical protein n=1 Tax=Marinilongibacter aquaticus TaxID=2975157 RepID=UPI0021BDEF95|nr:hypothetical protein [Marinilongibacter aquaticus]UBM59068.1 hypothetical protein LAG90_00140 [Marinilongibacter aquaticus]
MKLHYKHCFLLFAVQLISCNSPQNVALKAIEGYFPKNNIQFQDEAKALILVGKESFDENFGPAKTMSNEIGRLDFENNHYAAIVTSPSQTEKNIVIISSQIKGHTLEIEYALKYGEKRSFNASASKIFEVPKTVTAFTSICGERTESVSVVAS